MALRSIAAAALLSAAAAIAPLTPLLSEDPALAGVGVLTYDLGDTAFQPAGWHGPSELRAVVHYPTGSAPTPRPMILALHGMWWSCVDTATRAPTMGWPCREELANYRGFDYLADTLANQGFVVVSIGVNGIDAANPAAAYRDRARLVNEHLRLWRDLAATGRGPLAGRFVDPTTGRAVPVDFRGRVDLSTVGTIGHGQGGTAAMLHASAPHSWPRGVRVRAVLAAGAVYNYTEPAEVTDVPFAVLDGGCDASRGRQYLEDVRGRTRTGAYAFTVSGANHNNLNTEWTSVDDAVHEGLPPGRCTDGRPGDVAERQLTGAEQRRVATGYAAALFLRHLRDQTAYDPMLTGERSPLAGIARVDVAYARATGG